MLLALATEAGGGEQESEQRASHVITVFSAHSPGSFKNTCSTLSSAPGIALSLLPFLRGVLLMISCNTYYNFRLQKHLACVNDGDRIPAQLFCNIHAYGEQRTTNNEASPEFSGSIVNFLIPGL